jgi:hypothetical protein
MGNGFSREVRHFLTPGFLLTFIAYRRQASWLFAVFDDTNKHNDKVAMKRSIACLKRWRCSTQGR